MGYVIGIDTWEGNLQIDEPVVAAADVKLIVPRLNSMNGGHHMDENFGIQWAEASSFLRTPYFVYNPWVNGAENWAWLYNHVPYGCPPRYMLDIEVKYDGRSPQEYSNHVYDFIQRSRDNHLEPTVYTGKWFESYLAEWPTDTYYWWARYPYAVYPAGRTNISWADLTTKVNQLFWTTPAPGPCKLWQCTADRYVLPGCGNTCVDINLWNGTEQELADWLGAVIPVPQPTVEERLYRLEAEARSHGWNI